MNPRRDLVTMTLIAQENRFVRGVNVKNRGGARMIMIVPEMGNAFVTSANPHAIAKLMKSAP